MSDDQKREANADALAALAGGADPTPAQADEAQQNAEADQLQDDAAALAALSGKGSGGDAFGENPAADAAADVTAAAAMAGGGLPEPPDRPSEPPRDADDDEVADTAAAALAASDAGPVDLAAELAAHDGGRYDPAVELAIAAGEPAFEGATATTPDEKRARARRFDKQHKRAHAYQFKKTMIPLLLVVAVILLILGTAAIFMGTPPKPVDDTAAGIKATQARDAESGLGGFRPLLIIASFVVGPVLLLGAWLFYLDVRRSDQKAAPRRAATGGDRPSAP